jgi:hypothetical protein
MAAIAAYGAVRTLGAARAGSHGKAALVRAEAHLRQRDLDHATTDLQAARHDFRRSRSQLHAMGPLLTVARAVPFVRVQVRGTEAFARAGELLSGAGLDLTAAARTVIEPKDPNVPVGDSVQSLRTIRAAMTEGLTALDASIDEIAKLNGYRLVGPLANARADLAQRLPRVRRQASRAAGGLDAFLAFAGADGPKRYLVFSQNPDEVRPTGGFIGTYGVLTAGPDGIALERFAGIEEWIHVPAHADAVVPPGEAPIAFRIVQPEMSQRLANVNATPDWPTAARLAVDLWQRGGEQPVDGVLSFTPDALARLVAVLGPTEVPGFGETVDAHDFIERVDFHTHHEPPEVPGGRKRFVTVAVGAVVDKLLHAPASQWRDLAEALAASLDAREALAWSSDERVATVLQGFGWDGSFLGADGDFVGVSEFEYAAKNGRALRRTYDHHVQLRADGSARVTTAVTIDDPAPMDPLYNLDSLSYVVLYGPRRAKQAPGTDETFANEPSLAGHPAASWLLAAPPLGEDHAKVVWDVAGFAAKDGGRSMTYRLTWRPLPAHRGDKVRLRVDLPRGWRWAGARPPSVISLDAGFSRNWRVVRS